MEAATKEVRISMPILIEVANTFRPSISKAVLASYDQEHQKFSSTEKTTPTRGAIGFKPNT